MEGDFIFYSISKVPIMVELIQISLALLLGDRSFSLCSRQRQGHFPHSLLSVSCLWMCYCLQGFMNAKNAKIILCTVHQGFSKNLVWHEMVCKTFVSHYYFWPLRVSVVSRCAPPTHASLMAELVPPNTHCTHLVPYPAKGISSPSSWEPLLYPFFLSQSSCFSTSPSLYILLEITNTWCASCGSRVKMSPWDTWIPY